MIELIGSFYFPGTIPTVYDSQEMTALNLAGATAKKTDEVITLVNGQQADIDSREKAVNLTTSRKLSENGDFTGTIAGRDAQMVIADLISNTGLVAYLVEQVNSGAVSGRIIDCGTFDATGDGVIYDGGTF